MKHHHDPRSAHHLRDELLARRIARILGGIPTLRLMLATDKSAQATPARETPADRRARVLQDCERIAPTTTKGR